MNLIFLSLLAFSTGLCPGHPDHTDQLPSKATTEIAPAAILGHNNLQYSIDLHWAKVSPEVAPIINASAIAESKEGELYLVTDHPQNAFLVFKKDGTFVRAFGKGLEGGHSLEFFEHDGKELLIHVDCGWHFRAEGWNASRPGGGVTILKKDGTIVRRLPSPQELKLGASFEGKPFSPCDIAISPKGTILVVDGYATDFILEYSIKGEFIGSWGGPAEGKPGHLSNAHGISVDTTDQTKPLIWIASRNENKIKAFTPDGRWVETIDLPGAFAGQLFIRDGKMYTAVCWSKDKGTGKKRDESGFLLVIDAKTRKVISAPGGTAPVYKEGKLQPIYQKEPIFLHGHDLYVDDAGAIYLGEWNAKRRYPAKLTPTS
ncbi:hypothetical protein V2O64_10260 [Verrucomicrobiaceae bacterium 227]